MTGAGTVVLALVCTAGPSPRLTLPADAVKQCAWTLDIAQATATPLAALRTAMVGCKDLFAEEKCRQGFDEGAREQLFAAFMLGLVVQRCGEAYCPKLPEPKPVICKNPGYSKDPSKGGLANWAVLMRSANTLDLGLGAAEPLRQDVKKITARLMGMFERTASPPANAVEIRVSTHGSGVIVSVHGPRQAEPVTWTLPDMDEVTASAVVAAAQKASENASLPHAAMHLRGGQAVKLRTMKFIIRGLNAAGSEIWFDVEP